MVIAGAIARGDAPLLCARLARLLEGADVGMLECDVHDVDPADSAAVHGLARMQLTALRRGGRIRLCGCSSELRSLIELIGLSDVLDSGRDG